MKNIYVMFFFTESPRWLLSKNRKLEAKLILSKIRGPDIDIQEELKEIEVINQK